MMEYQKIINLLGNTPDQASKFKTKSWIEMNDDLHGKSSINIPIRFKILMLKSTLCDYGHVYILGNETITVSDTSATVDAGNNTNKKVLIKNCASFTDQRDKQ